MSSGTTDTWKNPSREYFNLGPIQTQPSTTDNGRLGKFFNSVDQISADMGNIRLSNSTYGATGIVASAPMELRLNAKVLALSGVKSGTALVKVALILSALLLAVGLLSSLAFDGALSLAFPIGATLTFMLSVIFSIKRN